MTIGRGIHTQGIEHAEWTVRLPLIGLFSGRVHGKRTPRRAGYR